MIGLKQWRDDIMNDIDNLCIWGYRMGRVRYRRIPRAPIITAVRNKLAHYETEYHKLKEATTGIELALWKNKMMDHCQGERRRSKRRKVGSSNLRDQCHVSCGADIVIGHVLPYLLPSVLPELELTDTD